MCVVTRGPGASTHLQPRPSCPPQVREGLCLLSFQPLKAKGTARWFHGECDLEAGAETAGTPPCRRPWMARCQHSPRSVAPGRVRPVLVANGSRPRGDAQCRQARAGVLRPKSKAPNSFGVRLCTFPGGSPEDPEPGLGCRGGQGPTETAVARTALGLLECNCRPKPAEINLGNFLGIPRELCRARQRSG